MKIWRKKFLCGQLSIFYLLAFWRASLLALVAGRFSVLFSLPRSVMLVRLADISPIDIKWPSC